MLERLGRAVGVSSVVLDQYLTGSDGEIIARPLARWRDPGEPLPGEVVLPKPMPLLRLGLGGWIETLQRGDMIEGSVDDFPGRVGEILRAKGVRAFLAVPIVMDKRLTGLLSLSECHEPRAWIQLEKDALRVFAGIIGSFLHRLESDRALRRSEERYRQVVESSSDYIFETDAEGRITYCSDRVQEVLGYPPELVVGRTPFDFLPPDDAAASLAAFREVSARIENLRVAEYRAISATGQIVWISTNAAPVLNESGMLIGYRGVTTDITARKRAESVLRSSEERYRGLVESQRHIIVRWTPDFRLVFANEAYYQLFGLDRRAVLGQPIIDSAPPEESEIIRELIETLSTPPFHVAHEQHAFPVGRQRWISWESFAIHDDTGRIVEIQAMGRDVTHERTTAEDLLRRDRILAAVNTAAEHLLGSSNWETVIADVMERLGHATGVARVRFWELRTLEEGRRVLALRASWEAPGCPATDGENLDGPLYLDDPGFVPSSTPRLDCEAPASAPTSSPSPSRLRFGHAGFWVFSPCRSSSPAPGGGS
jgi:PAS domain S-box-containing protein